MKDDQRVALTKRLLQEGLFRLLERKDIDSIHVSELCAESGINRATFYRHYSEPRDILKNMRQNGKLGNIGRGFAALPLTDGSGCDSQAFGKLFLGHIPFPPELFDI